MVFEIRFSTRQPSQVTDIIQGTEREILTIQNKHSIFQRVFNDFRQMLSSIETNDITDTRRQVQHTSLGNCTLNKLINVVSSIPER